MKILVADDDPVSCRLLESLLRKWSYEVLVVHDGTEAWSALQADDAPRLALLDWMMPGMDGLEVCRRVRSRPSKPYVYTMLLTANDKIRNVVEGLDSGADDYVVKPFHPEELKARLRVGTRMLNLESNLVETREVLRFKASHDALTGVWNRGSILELLERELKRAQRDGSAVGVLLTDLDHFKLINDTAGHLAGDDVLRAVTGRLKAAVRGYDAVGRYGGEEFLVLLPGCDSANLGMKAEQLRNAVSSAPVETSAGPISVTMSMGGIVSSEWKTAGPDQLLRVADSALYRAKAAGRNRVEVSHPSDSEAARITDQAAGAIDEVTLQH